MCKVSHIVQHLWLGFIKLLSLQGYRAKFRRPPYCNRENTFKLFVFLPSLFFPCKKLILYNFISLSENCSKVSWKFPSCLLANNFYLWDGSVVAIAPKAIQPGFDSPLNNYAIVGRSCNFYFT